MKKHLSHVLQSRHILMISLGSAIGTGLFFGAGQSIKMAGPAIILAYILGGFFMYIVVRALGEMIVHDPNVGAFSYYAHKYVGSYAGFISGWNFWVNYVIVCMLELTATTIFLDYWFPNLGYHWLIILCLILFFAIVNVLNVRFFGEFEFWFAGIKVAVILMLIVLGVYIIATGYKGIHSASSIPGIANLWKNGGFFATGIGGFLSSLVVVAFSFGGIELVGISAGEAKNPKKAVPVAINSIIVRILLFYIATLTIIMCLYPWNKINGNISPFVDVFHEIGISSAATIMNIVAITATLSSFNSGVYSTGRMLYSLGERGSAPAFIAKLNKNGVPSNAIAFSLVFVLLAVLLNYLYPKQVFMVLLALATIAGIFNWVIILYTHYCFRKTVGKGEYALKLFPFLPILTGVFFVVILVMMILNANMKLAVYIAPLWILVLSIGYLFKVKLNSKGN